MNVKELAAQLNGAEYPPRIDRKLEAQITIAGLVVVYGASDDLMEFRGAIHDEIGAYDGAEAHVDPQGLLPAWDELLDRGNNDALRDYFKREGKAKKIEALWCAEEGCSWTYRTDIPHEVFYIIEDGEKFCRGIVFSLADCAP